MIMGHKLPREMSQKVCQVKRQRCLQTVPVRAALPLLVSLIVVGLFVNQRRGVTLPAELHFSVAGFKTGKLFSSNETLFPTNKTSLNTVI